jgi:hypothetical protein
LAPGRSGAQLPGARRALSGHAAISAVAAINAPPTSVLAQHCG